MDLPIQDGDFPSFRCWPEDQSPYTLPYILPWFTMFGPWITIHHPGISLQNHPFLEGSATACSGRNRGLLSPKPSWPCWLQPQAHSKPLAVRAKEWLAPQQTPRFLGQRTWESKKRSYRWVNKRQLAPSCCRLPWTLEYYGLVKGVNIYI